MLDQASGDWLGFVALNYVGAGTDGVARNEVEIGWWTVRAAWVRGYASEGATAIRGEGFERVRMNRMIARLQPANTASARVAERIGMRFERDRSERSGESLHIYALDRAEWKRLRRVP